MVRAWCLETFPWNWSSQILKEKFHSWKGTETCYILVAIYSAILCFFFFPLISYRQDICQFSYTQRRSDIFQTSWLWLREKNQTMVLFKNPWDFVLKQGKRQKVEEGRIKYLCISKEKQYNFSDTVAKWLFIPHTDWQIKQVYVILKWLLIRVTSPLQSGLCQLPSEASVGKEWGRLQGHKNISH